MTGLAVEGVTKRFGSVVALDGIALEVEESELLVVLGPSGCGKSTLLRVVAGLEVPDEGTVSIAGREVTRRSPGARNVSMVFQSHALFPHMTARDNIGFGLVVRETPRDRVRARVDEAAALVGLGDVLGRFPSELSGGERQRVALARALVRDPDVFLLDEPLSNLDAELRSQMRVELRRLHDGLGATMVYVTHDQPEALALGDRVAIMRAGRIEQIGTPDELWAGPANRFVARFVGAMNVVSPAVLDVDVEGRAVDVGVRPEHVEVGGVGVAGRVELVEPLGSEAVVHIRTEAGELRARVPVASRPPVGATVRVSAAREHVHLFDRETGERRSWT